MNIRERAETFSRYVGLELKGKITTQGFTAKAVAEAIGRQPAAFNRWLNGKVEIPITVFCEACEYIDVEPQKLVEDAYSRLAVEHGERDGRVYLDPDFDILVKRGDGVIGKPDALAPVTPIAKNVGGLAENVNPHDIDFTKADLDLAATDDRTGIKDQDHPDYENHSQESEDGE